MKERTFSETTIICKSCKKEVKRTSNRQWWCSRNCGERFKRKLAKEKRERYPKYQKVCGYCKKEFVTNSNKKIFCCIEHKEKFYNNLQKKLGLRNKYRQGNLCSGNWHKILKRANYTCELCGLSSTTNDTDGLVVHHLDGNGEYSKQKNNEIDNLLVVCRRCHKMFHGLSLIFQDGEWKVRSRFLRLLGCHNISVV